MHDIIDNSYRDEKILKIPFSFRKKILCVPNLSVCLFLFTYNLASDSI